MADFENSSLAAKVFEQAAEIATLHKRVEELEKDHATLIQCRQELLGVEVRAGEALMDLTGQLKEEQARLDWLLPRVSGSSYRAIGIVYSEGPVTREHIDAARNAVKEPR